jgi:hypothetical protein
MNLNSAPSTIVLVALAFAAGFASAKMLGTENRSATEAQVASCSAPSNANALVADVTAASASAPERKQPTAPSSKIIPIVPSGPNKVAGPVDDPVLDLVRDRFPEAKVVIRKANEDGTFVSKEALADGESILRSFNTRGELVGEDWKQSSGDEIVRTYYDGGGIKGFSLKHMDGAATYITFTQSGVFKGRSDTFPDGDQITTNYDDQGRVLDKWRKSKDGRSVRIQ